MPDIMPNFLALLAEVIIVGLAAARIWRLVGADELTEGLRQWLGLRSPAGARFVDFLGCPWCAGFWIGVAVYAAVETWPDLIPIAGGLAIVQLVGMFGQYPGGE